MQRQASGALSDGNVGATMDDDICSGRTQVGLRKCCEQRNNTRPCNLTGQNAGGRIFANNALAGAEAEFRGCFEKRFRIGFAAGHVSRGNHAGRDRQAGGTQPSFRQAACARSRDRPAMWRKARQEFHRPRQHNDSFRVVDFSALNFPVLRFVIGVRKEMPDGAQAGPAVGVGHDYVGVKATFRRPFGPNPLDRGSGINEDAVKIKQDGTTQSRFSPVPARQFTSLCSFP